MKFNILQNNIEDVQKSKQMWKITYGLSTSREVEQTPIEVGEDKEDDIEQGIVEGSTYMDIETQALVEEEKQTKQSVQDEQLLSDSPPSETSTNIEIVKVKDLSKTISQNINPLTQDDLKRILLKTTLQAKLIDNPILVSVDEIQKIDTITTREEVQALDTTLVTP